MVSTTIDGKFHKLELKTAITDDEKVKYLQFIVDDLVLDFEPLNVIADPWKPQPLWKPFINFAVQIDANKGAQPVQLTLVDAQIVVEKKSL